MMIVVKIKSVARPDASTQENITNVSTLLPFVYRKRSLGRLTYITSNIITGMYNCFGPGGDRAAGGTAILVRQGIIHSHLQLDTSLQATAVRITLSKTITLCSIYIPPSSAISLHDMDDLVRQLPTPYMLLGDFNSHNPLWGGNTIDGKGQRVEQFMDNHSLCFLNDGSYTYFHPGYGTYTAIDLTITQPNLLLDFSWRVLDDLWLCGGDHFPIVIKHQGPATGGREPGWRLKKADWHSFRALCDERLTADIHNSTSKAIASFTDTLISIADETVPKSSAAPKHVINPWLDADCEKAIKDRKKAERKFNRQPTAENLTTFKIKRAMARRVIEEKRRQCWRQFVSSINNCTPLSKSLETNP